jgi:predicted enzyme related to lactoylglutathione lyase
MSAQPAAAPASTPTFTFGKFVWYEHMSPDAERAQAFYNALFGWHTQPVPMGDAMYPMVKNGGNGIGGYRQAGPKAPTHWICFISVPDVDASFDAVKAQGLRTMQQPTDYGPGRIAAAQDPTGAAFAMWHGFEGDRADAPAGTGDWHWTELWTPDPSTALAFYEDLVDYGIDTMELPFGDYHLLTIEGLPRAGVMKAAPPHGQALWLPYVAVDDCDATLARAEQLGGKVFTPARDVYGVGRFAVLVDAVGAAIGVIKPE